MEGMDLSLAFANTVELDLQNFLCTSSLYPCNIAPCTEVLHRVNYGGLVILLGVWGVGLFLARYREKEAMNKDYEYWRQKFNALQWIFEDGDVNEECSDPFFSTFLKGFSFGILSPQPLEMSSPAPYHDISLNSLTEKHHHQKFLKQPLKASENIAKRKFTKDLGSEFEKNRIKKIPFNKRLKAAKDKLIIQRVVASNRLSFKSYKPGSDMRMEGDGSENPENFCEDQSNTSFKSDSKPMKESSPVMICKDLNCKNPHCLETESQSEEVHHLNTCCDSSNNLADFLKNAEELKRFIRETSFDSLASDLSFVINLGFDEEHIEPVMDLHSFGDGSIHPIACIGEDGLEDSTQKGTVNEHYLWKLTDISYETESISDPVSHKELLAIPHSKHSRFSSGKSEASDDVSSYAGSVLDNLEWDDDFYFGDDTLAILDDNQFEQNTLHQSWLPDTCQDLDLEKELGENNKDSIRSSRSSSVRFPRGRRSPPSGCASVERESLSRQSRSSTNIENITITCPMSNP